VNASTAGPVLAAADPPVAMISPAASTLAAPAAADRRATPAAFRLLNRNILPPSAR
jgi:hypothetical protein